MPEVDIKPSETIAWLRAYVPGFDALTIREISEATDFLLLWSIFELNALSGNANVGSILKFADKLDSTRTIDQSVLEEAVGYFKNRYFSSGNFTEAFSSLYNRADQGKAVVEEFLRSETKSSGSDLTAVHLIIYRLRNNFVHGTKMAYGLAGQLENFRHANSFIKEVLTALHKQV